MNETPTRGRYLLAIRDRWVVVVLAVALSVAGAAAYTLTTEKRYEASADVLVSPVSSDTLLGLPVLRENLFGRSVLTAGRLAKSPQVAARVRDRLNLDMSPAAVSALITVKPQEQSDILTITGIGDSPRDAATVANAFAQTLLADRTEQFQKELRGAIARLSTRLEAVRERSGSAPEVAALSDRLAEYRALSGSRDPTLDIVSSAVPPSAPASPRPRLNIVIASVIGLLLGLGIAVGLEVANPIVRRAESVEERDGPPILARMPRPQSSDARTALSFPYDVPTEMRAPIRSLWANLGTLVAIGSPGRTLLITSGGLADGDAGGEGAPEVAALLAAVMAKAGESVVLLDADLERGPVRAMIDGGGASHVDIADALASGSAQRLPRVVPNAEGVIGGRDRLQVMVPDVPGRQPTTWLAPERLSRFVVELKRRKHRLLILAPPPPAAETTVLADLADAVIIVVALGHTRLDRLSEVREGLAQHGVTQVGFVVLERSSLSARIAKASSNVKSSTRWT